MGRAVCKFPIWWDHTFCIHVYSNIVQPLACVTAFFGGRDFENSPTGCGQLVKMLITLKPHGVFGSKFAYLFILTLSSHWKVKRWRGFAKHKYGWSWSVSQNPHISLTIYYILIKFCLRIHFNIVWPLVCKTGTKFCRNIRLQPPPLPPLPTTTPTINSGTALTDTDCSSIHSPNLSTVRVYMWHLFKV